MKILIVEADPQQAGRLKQHLIAVAPQLDQVETCGALKSCLKKLDTFLPDLLFLDAELGMRNPELERELPACPLVLMGSEHRRRANSFGRHCFDYLDRPVELANLKNILRKYQTLKNHFVNSIDRFIDYLNDHNQSKKRFLIKGKSDYYPLLPEDIVCIGADKKLISLTDKNNKQYIVEEYSLNSISKKLDESLFYRANRKFIINVNYIRRLKPLSKSRVSVELALPLNPEIMISRENSMIFKKWLGDL